MSRQENLPVNSKTDRPNWLHRGLVGLTLVGCVITLSNNTPDPDLWGHVRYGQDVIEAGQLHRTATHTFTAEGYRWINHENLAELSLAIGYDWFGARGLLIIKALLGLLVIALMIVSSIRRGTRLTTTCCCALLTSLTLAAFWPLRPQLASFVLLALVVAVLDQAFVAWGDDRKLKPLWLLLLPPLMFVWTNSHGAFVAGVCLTSAYLGIRAFEVMWHRDENAIRKISMLVAAVAGCWFATLVNPYGLELHAWLVESLRTPRPEITEWAAPKLGDDFFMPFAVLAFVVFASLVGTKRRRDPAHIALLALCFWQATCHSRHIALFAILAGFWIPEHFASLLRRSNDGKRSQSCDANEARPSATSGPVRGFAFAMLLVFAMFGFKIYESFSDFPVKRSQYPVSALQFIRDEGLTGKLVVSFDWAQYALAALAPDVNVQFDGRFRTCYPQEVIDMHFDFLIGEEPTMRCRSSESGPFDPARVLRHGEPNLVLVDRHFPHSVHVMRTMQDDFSLLYQDGVSQVWGRDSVYSDLGTATFVSNDRRSVTNEPQIGAVTWPGFPTESSSAASRLHANLSD